MTARTVYISGANLSATGYAGALAQYSKLALDPVHNPVAPLVLQLMQQGYFGAAQIDPATNSYKLLNQAWLRTHSLAAPSKADVGPVVGTSITQAATGSLASSQTSVSSSGVDAVRAPQLVLPPQTAMGQGMSVRIGDTSDAKLPAWILWAAGAGALLLIFGGRHS